MAIKLGIIGFGGMGSWHVGYIQKSDVCELAGIYDIKEERRAAAKEAGIPIISCMGTGNKLAPEKLTIADITKTHTCPLARSMRARLREAGVAHVDVLFSTEAPRTPAVRCEEDGRVIPATVSYVPAVAGMMLGSYVIRRLLEIE